jgi:hypothetical protein
MRIIIDISGECDTVEVLSKIASDIDLGLLFGKIFEMGKLVAVWEIE